MSERTIYGVISEYRKEWGVVLSTLSLHEAIKLAIEVYSPINPIPSHFIFLGVVLVLWAASDHIDIETNTNARFWR